MPIQKLIVGKPVAMYRVSLSDVSRRLWPRCSATAHIAHICTQCVCFSGFVALERQNRHPIHSKFATELFKRGLPLLSFPSSSTLHFHCDRPVNKLQGSPCLLHMASPKVNPQEISTDKKWWHSKGISLGQKCHKPSCSRFPHVKMLIQILPRSHRP